MKNVQNNIIFMLCEETSHSLRWSIMELHFEQEDIHPYMCLLNNLHKYSNYSSVKTYGGSHCVKHYARWALQKIYIACLMCFMICDLWMVLLLYSFITSVSSTHCEKHYKHYRLVYTNENKRNIHILKLKHEIKCLVGNNLSYIPYLIKHIT